MQIPHTAGPTPLLRTRYLGFTLIELLVVIAIIALLAAILFPVFGRSRENARRSACQSNLRQIGLSVFQYYQDYDETVGAIPEGDSKTGTWLAPYMPYIKNIQLLRCPSAPANNRTNVNSKNDYNRNKIMMAWVDGGVNPDEIRAIPYTQLCDPSRTWLAFDGKGSSDWSDLYYSRAANRMGQYGATWETATDNKYILAAGRHLDGFNALYFDGHVKYIPLAKAFAKEDGTILGNTANQSQVAWNNLTNTHLRSLSPSGWYTLP